MKPPTYYVLDPRNEPCETVNPQLWREFCNKFGSLHQHNFKFFTEAFCVQWLDAHYEAAGTYSAEFENAL